MVVALSSPAGPWPAFVTSAPGKVILFGEHAVVYGKTAVAGSLDMRAYALCTPRTDGLARLLLPDISVDATLPFASLPCRASVEQLAHPGDVAGLLAPHVLADYEGGPGRTAILTFAYLCASLVDEAAWAEGFSLCVRSLVPVGSGLGSSAAFHVALATALLRISGRLTAVDALGRKLVDAWAFRGEQVAHGTPSGIDNAVATHGGFLRYTKGAAPQPLGNSAAGGSSSAAGLRMLVCDTHVPKSTMALVAGVRELRDQHTEAIDAVMQAIDSISTRAADLLAAGKPGCAEAERHLAGAVRLNHGLLCALGVGHPALDLVCRVAGQRCMPAKLTGAGGGGCALVLVPAEADEQAVAEVTGELVAAGFACYPTVVGGPGVAMDDFVDGVPVARWVEAAPSELPGGADGQSDLIERFAALPDAALAQLAPRTGT
ncbi:Mevalonate kinase [Coemansia erecta]|uniref:Mevalonate kinase n=1 Tax=Coemansia erecta TaxID=147472 RepID=A0A9W8CR02_9FUNG|nr:Mevalonate kinase [Coemansia erecta]